MASIPPDYNSRIRKCNHHHLSRKPRDSQTWQSSIFAPQHDTVYPDTVQAPKTDVSLTWRSSVLATYDEEDQGSKLSNEKHHFSADEPNIIKPSIATGLSSTPIPADGMSELFKGGKKTHSAISKENEGAALKQKEPTEIESGRRHFGTSEQNSYQVGDLLRNQFCPQESGNDVNEYKYVRKQVTPPKIKEPSPNFSGKKMHASETAPSVPAIPAAQCTETTDRLSGKKRFSTGQTNSSESVIN